MRLWLAPSLTPEADLRPSERRMRWSILVVWLVMAAGCRAKAPEGESESIRALEKSGLRWSARAFQGEARDGHLEEVKRYLDAGMAADAMEHPVEHSALCLAASQGHLGVMRLLLDRGAKADVVGSRGGETPLLGAIRARKREAARLLLDRGASVDGPEGLGWTPLTAAAQEGDPHLVKLLLSRGADPKRTTRSGQTPLDIARWLEREEVIELLPPEPRP